MKKLYKFILNLNSKIIFLKLKFSKIDNYSKIENENENEIEIE